MLRGQRRRVAGAPCVLGNVLPPGPGMRQHRRLWPGGGLRSGSGPGLPAGPQAGVPGSELAVLVREQAALRRVATLVAREASLAEVFGVVAQEAAGSLDIPMISVVRFGSGGRALLQA